MDNRFWFISYAARSGSTKFAYELQRSANDALVVPETRLLEALFLSSELPDEGALRSWLEADWQLPEYSDLSVDDMLEQILSGLSSRGLEGALEQLAAIALDRNASDLQGKTIIFKWGSAVHHWPAVKRANWTVGHPQLIVVHRHPCATVNSLLKTERAYFANENMGRSDVWHCAQLWRRHALAAHSLGDEVLRISYQDVLSSERMHQIIGDLGLSISEEEHSDAAEFHVAASEQGLHALLKQSGSRERIEAWQHELPKSAQALVGRLCGASAEIYGYPMGEPASALTVARYFGIHQFRTAQHGFRRMRQFGNSPRVIVQHARSRVRERF